MNRSLITTTLAVMAMAAVAHANFKSLSQRLPASSNAVIAVNVQKLLATPYAKQEQWAENSIAAWEKEPLMIPPGSKQLIMAAEVSSSMESIWECTVMELDKVPTAQAIAQAEGGHVDKLWDKESAASPINAYFIPLDGKTLASITPANRTAIVKWLRTPVKPEGNVTSEYLQKVLAGLNDQTDIVMAMDLEGAFGVPRIRRWLDENDIKELKGSNLDEVARLLGTMKGITVDLRVNQDVTAQGAIEFDRDAAILGEAAKPILIEVLNTAGMRMDDVQNWTFTSSGNRVTMNGPVTTAGLRRLLSIVQSPIPAATVAEKPAASNAAASNDPAVASQKYYKVVCSSLDSFGNSASASQSATWARTIAKRIDQLPILNVDPQLVEWGAMVSTKLKLAGGTMAIGQTQMNSRVAGVLDPAYSSYVYDNEGNYSAVQEKGESENAARQRRQVALEQKAQAQEQALQVLKEIADTRPAIRQAMVQKYKVEF